MSMRFAGFTTGKVACRRMMGSFQRRAIRHESTTTTTTATKEATKDAAKETLTKAKVEETKKATGLWNSAEFWGGMGAIAGWGMSISAIYDAFVQGPEVISLTMTPVLITYSSLFARWAYVVKPQNLLLCSCHVANVMAQGNQLRRVLEHKMNNGEQEQVNDFMKKTAMGGAALTGAVIAGPTVRAALTNAELGVVSKVAAADAGPFTVHFWGPMSKWLISGASFFELDRPTEKISLAQYSALTLTGFFFSRYSMLVKPVNYVLCSVNIALFGSSAWHLGRKINADFIQGGPKKDSA